MGWILNGGAAPTGMLMHRLARRRTLPPKKEQTHPPAHLPARPPTHWVHHPPIHPSTHPLCRATQLGAAVAVRAGAILFVAPTKKQLVEGEAGVIEAVECNAGESRKR